MRKRQVLVFFGGFALFIIFLASVTKVPTFRWARKAKSDGGNNGTDTHLGKAPWTRLVGGADGYYVFENVYVRDRMLCESQFSTCVST